MKTKEFISLARKLNPSFPGMVVHGPMMFIPPVRPVLRGLYFEGSSFDAKSFYVWAFWLPLYVPNEHINFNFGKRIYSKKSGERWKVDSTQLLEELTTALRTDAIPFLTSVETTQGILDAVHQATITSNNPHVHEASCYTLVKAGRTQEAIYAIDVLLNLINSDVPWQTDIGTRANLLKAKLNIKVEDANAILESWIDESVRNLGLENIS